MIFYDNGNLVMTMPPFAIRQIRKIKMITHTKAKLPTDVRRKRNLAHDRASELWGEAKILSPIGGLAELVRGEDMPVPTHVKMANRAAFKRRNAESVAAATRYEQYKPKGSDRYFPHQGPRELARRAKQQLIIKDNAYQNRQPWETYLQWVHRVYGGVTATLLPSVTVECSAVPGQGGATSDINLLMDAQHHDSEIAEWTETERLVADAEFVAKAENSFGPDVLPTSDEAKHLHALAKRRERERVFSQQPDGSVTVGPLAVTIIDIPQNATQDAMVTEIQRKHEEQLAKRRERDRARREAQRAEKG